MPFLKVLTLPCVIVIFFQGCLKFHADMEVK
jgi:hypothetical protein